MSPSFKMRYIAIEASSALLEALIESLLPVGGIAIEIVFQIAIKLLDCYWILVCLCQW